MSLPFLAIYTGGDLAAHCHCIYGLFDPRRPDVVMYIGQTRNHVLQRFGEHLQDAYSHFEWPASQTPKDQWILRLAEQGIVPSVGVIEMVPRSESLDAAEREWIVHFWEAGQAELNRKVRLANYHRSRIAAHAALSDAGESVS